MPTSGLQAKCRAESHSDRGSFLAHGCGRERHDRRRARRCRPQSPPPSFSAGSSPTSLARLFAPVSAAAAMGSRYMPPSGLKAISRAENKLESGDDSRRRRKAKRIEEEKNSFSHSCIQLTGRSAGRDTGPGRRSDARTRQARRGGEGRLHSGASRARGEGKRKRGFHSLKKFGGRERKQ